MTSDLMGFANLKTGIWEHLCHYADNIENNLNITVPVTFVIAIVNLCIRLYSKLRDITGRNSTTTHTTKTNYTKLIFKCIATVELFHNYKLVFC